MTGRADIDTDLIDAIVIFECGHSFPKNYVQGDFCPICAKNQSQRGLFSLKIFSLISFIKALNVLQNPKRGGGGGLQKSVLDPYASTLDASIVILKENIFII